MEELDNHHVDDISLLSDDASYLLLHDGEEEGRGQLGEVHALDKNVFLDADANGTVSKHHHHHKQHHKHRRHSKSHAASKTEVGEEEAGAEDALRSVGETNEFSGAPVPPRPPVQFAINGATFEEGNNHLKFTVEFLPVDSGPARTVLCRSDATQEAAYAAAVGQTFEMPLFPQQLKEGAKYKDEFVQCSKFVMSTRIRRLLLEEELRSLFERNQQFVDLMALCQRKKAAHRQRLLMLEKEMEHIAEEKQGVMVTPGSRFGALLTLRAGWVLVVEFLSRECKRLQQPKQEEGKKEPATEEFNEDLTLDDILRMWDLLQQWQLFHSVTFRSKSGRSYPIPAKKNEEASAKNETLGEDSSSASVPNPKANAKATREAPALESILKGQEAALAAVIDEVNDSASLHDQQSLDNSSIATIPTADKGGLPKATPSHASLGSNEEEGSKASKKTKKSQGPAAQESHQEEKKSGGAWGFSFNLFGSKPEEVAEVVVAPTMIKLDPLVHGFGVGEWSEVCEALGCLRGEISLLAGARALLEKIQSAAADENHLLHGIIPLGLKADFQHSLESMSTLDETNPTLNVVAKQVIDCIADRLESLLIESLRLYPNWQKTLESFRKDRIKKTGGRMDQNQDGEVEVDKQGTIRIIPNADQIIDTDILHGSRQRIQVSAALPELEKRIGAAQAIEDKLRGELACVIQFGFCLVSPLLQRAMRGTLARMRKRVIRRDLTLYAMHAAAFTLQGYFRAKQGKQSFAAAKAAVIGDLRTDMCLVLQRNLRMLPKWFNHKKYVKQRKYDSWWFAITSFQAIIRGFNARHRVRNMKNKHKGSREVEEKLWNVELLQRVARGYIARKTIVRSLKVRKNISRRVLLLAEKYLQGGDLWGFLKEIDDEFTRLGKEIAATAQREDELAHTFIQQVLDKRQGDFDGAWDRFSRSVTAQSPNRRGGPGDSVGNNLSAVSTEVVVKAPWGPSKLQAGKTVRDDDVPAAAATAIPGPLLRRAVSATVQDGVQREVQRQKEGQSRGVKLSQEMKEAYGKDDDDAKGKSRTVKGVKKGSSTVKLVESAVPGSGQIVKSKNKKEIENLLRSQKRQRNGQGLGNMQATTADFMSQAVASSSTTGYAESKERDPTTGWSMEKACQGESLLLDIPKGINDTMERLLRAAAIRCFVPEFFSGHEVASAYKMYLILPPGLAKMRYEQEAYLYCQPAVNALRVKGVNRILDAMPPKRVKQFLVSVSTPPKLLNLTMDFLYTLIKMSDVPSGIVHSPTAQRQTDFSEGKGTLQQVLHASVSLAATSPPENINLVSAGRISSDKSANPTIQGAVKPARSHGIELMPNSSTSENQEENLPDVDPTLPNRLLVDMVERGQWSSMQAAADELLMHAAFLVVPFVEKVKLPGGEVLEIPTDYGHAAFKAHTKALQRANSEEDKRELVRERFRAALMLTTPYTLRLKADGTLSVMDLLERPNLGELGMPPALFDQVEALLSTAVSLSVSSKVVPTVRDHLSTSKEIFAVPMVFDPRFQRGPFDPYGRAPRIMPKLRPKATKPDGPSRASSFSPEKRDIAGPMAAAGQDKDDEEDLPGGLWDNKGEKAKSSHTTRHAKKLWGFQSDLQQQGNQGEGGGLQESSLTGLQERPLSKRDREKQPGHQGKNDKERPLSKRDMHERAKGLKHDFEAKVRSGFERPYRCSHAGCDQAFSRAYSLKVHEKSHSLFPDYHKFRSEAQIFLDPDKVAAEAHVRAAFEAKTLLPPLGVQEEIYQLRVKAAHRAFELAYDDEPPRQLVDTTTYASRPPTAGQLYPELAWPSPLAPAARALDCLPQSRQRVFSPPSSPWALPSGSSPASRSSSIFSREGFSRGGSRAGIGSRGGVTTTMAITPWETNCSPTVAVKGVTFFEEQVDDDDFELQAPPIRFGMNLEARLSAAPATINLDPFNEYV